MILMQLPYQCYEAIIFARGKFSLSINNSEKSENLSPCKYLHVYNIKMICSVRDIYFAVVLP